MPSTTRKSVKTVRNYDNESGKNRVTRKGPSRPPPPPDTSSESEVSQSDSDVEQQFDIKTKDSRRAKPIPARTRKVQAQVDTQNETKGEENDDKEDAVAPATNLLIAMAYRQGSSAVQFDSRSYFVPDASSLFSAAFTICALLTHNTLVHEYDPGFTSIAFYLYVGHLYYYQVLRIRDITGVLTREERRCLRKYNNIGQPEAWPVPSPLIGILETIGFVQPPSKYYGKIIPSLPSFTGFTAGSSLRGIMNINSLSRVPIIPALQEFLHNYGSNVATFVGDTLLPVASATLTPAVPATATANAVAANTFVGFDTSGPASTTQALFNNTTWKQPAETDPTLINYPHSLKRSLTARMRVPAIGDNHTITGIETFLGFQDGVDFLWIHNLLKIATTVSRFFPNSSNLSAISTVTQEEIITPIFWSQPVRLNPVADQWYPTTDVRTYSIEGKVNTEHSGNLYKVAASASINSHYTPSVIPLGIPATCYTSAANGPYFVNPPGSTSRPLTLVEIVEQPDPIRNMLPFIDEKLYDNLGGRAR